MLQGQLCVIAVSSPRYQGEQNGVIWGRVRVSHTLSPLLWLEERGAKSQGHPRGERVLVGCQCC